MTKEVEMVIENLPTKTRHQAQVVFTGDFYQEVPPYKNCSHIKKEREKERKQKKKGSHSSWVYEANI